MPLKWVHLVLPLRLLVEAEATAEAMVAADTGVVVADTGAADTGAAMEIGDGEIGMTLVLALEGMEGTEDITEDIILITTIVPQATTTVTPLMIHIATHMTVALITILTLTIITKQKVFVLEN